MGYAKSEWNLNNLPVVPNSVLKHIDIDISGMKVGRPSSIPYYKIGSQGSRVIASNFPPPYLYFSCNDFILLHFCAFAHVFHVCLFFMYNFPDSFCVLASSFAFYFSLSLFSVDIYPTPPPPYSSLVDLCCDVQYICIFLHVADLCRCRGCMWGCASPPSAGTWRTTGPPASTIFTGANPRLPLFSLYSREVSRINCQKSCRFIETFEQLIHCRDLLISVGGAEFCFIRIRIRRLPSMLIQIC